MPIMQKLVAVNMRTRQEKVYLTSLDLTAESWVARLANAHASGDVNWWDELFTERWPVEMGKHHAFSGDWAVCLNSGEEV